MFILQEGLQFTWQSDHQHSSTKKLTEHLGKGPERQSKRLAIWRHVCLQLDS